MPPPGRPRLHPIAALKALRGHTRDREDTRQVFLLIEALRGRTTLRQLARFAASETGRTMLAERRSLLAVLADRARLAQMPPGSLGRAYSDFMTGENLSAEGLVEASKIGRAPTTDDITWFRARNREMHDLLHVVAGYGRDPLGEVCITAFSFAQTGLKGFAVIAAVGALRAARRLRGQPVRRAVWQAYRRGRRAEWLIGADWESLLEEPLAAVRARFRVASPTYYPCILAGMQNAGAASDRLRLARPERIG